jgi:hypothetical protein
MSVEQEKEPEFKRVSEGDYLLALRSLEGHWTKLLRRAISELQKVYDAKNSLFEAKDNGLQVRFFEDEQGEMSFSIEEKPPMGLVPTIKE